eukprot:NODE_667_length_4902_cov_0.676660.p4 type:complete len:136 gc:universal NODE_667_length_4902_cov_0.676660:2189-1782(-)
MQRSNFETSIAFLKTPIFTSSANLPCALERFCLIWYLISNPFLFSQYPRYLVNDSPTISHFSIANSRPTVAKRTEISSRMLYCVSFNNSMARISSANIKINPFDSFQSSNKESRILANILGLKTPPWITPRLVSI